MKNEALAQAQKLLQQRRLAEEVALSERMDEIEQNVPEVMKVRQKLAMTAVELSRLILAHKEDVQSGVEKIRQNNLALQAEEKRLLRERGYAEDYLQIRYRCPLCEDTGYRDGARCQCLDALVRQIGLEELNKVSNLRLTGFGDFDLRYYPDMMDPGLKVIPREWMGKVLQFCRKYTDEFDLHSKGLFMQGDTGLGKTHLSLAIAAGVIRKGYCVVYGSTQDFLRMVENEHFRRFEGKDGSGETLDGLLDADLLILDDLGAEFATQFTQSVIYNLINTRLNREKPTIISTNLSRRELEDKYTQRVVSRLYTQFTCLRFVGKDIRQLKSARQ